VDSTTDAYIWSVVEPGMAIITACLPTLAPLLRGFKEIGSITAIIRSAFSFQGISSKHHAPTAVGSEMPKSKGIDVGKSWHKLGSVRGTSHDNIITHDSNVELDDLAKQNPDGITVQRTFESEIQIV